MLKTALPHAVDAERALLGAFLLDAALIAQADEQLTAAHFFDARHRIIFTAVLACAAAGHADPVIVARRLDAAGNLAAAGGNDYIAELADIGASPPNVPAYIELLRHQSLLRDIISACHAGAQCAHKPGDDSAEAVLDAAEARLSAVGDLHLRRRSAASTAGAVAGAVTDRMVAVAKSGEYASLRGIAAGIAGWDAATNGLHAGELTIIAGRPGSGKTAFALCAVRHITAEPDVAAIIFSLEMDAESLVHRLLSQSSHGVDLRRMHSGKKFASADLSNLAAAAAELGEHEIRIEDAAALNLLEARSRARRQARELRAAGKRLGCIVVDYLQLMEAAVGKENRAAEVAAITRGLKALAKELQAPVLALSQLNRNLETRAVQKPMLADLKESGAIEQDADVVLFLWEDRGDPPGTKLIIGKNRNGPVGEMELVFDKARSIFTQPSYRPPESDVGAADAIPADF